MLGGGGKERTRFGVSLGTDGRGSGVSLLARILHPTPASTAGLDDAHQSSAASEVPADTWPWVTAGPG